MNRVQREQIMNIKRVFFSVDFSCSMYLSSSYSLFCVVSTTVHVCFCYVLIVIVYHACEHLFFVTNKQYYIISIAWIRVSSFFSSICSGFAFACAFILCNDVCLESLGLVSAGPSSRAPWRCYVKQRLRIEDDEEIHDFEALFFLSWFFLITKNVSRCKYDRMRNGIITSSNGHRRNGTITVNHSRVYRIQQVLPHTVFFPLLASLIEDTMTLIFFLRVRLLKTLWLFEVL